MKITSKEIIKLYLEGLSTWKIAPIAGVSQTEIRRILQRNNIISRTAAEFHNSHKNEKSSRWSGYEDISGSVWGKIKRIAKNRKIKFNISIKEGWDLFLKQERKCVFCGDILYFPKSDQDFKIGNWTASLDRINSFKDYTIDNVQWIRKDINIMKWQLSQDRFLYLCNEVTANGKV